MKRIILQVAALVMAVTIHEVAHGWTAWRCGDPTARMMGRITANPIKHLDPVGSVILPLLLVLTRSPVLFGWARPVPVQIRNLRKLPRDSILVSVSGVTANFLGAFAAGLVLRGLLTQPELLSGPFPGTALYTLAGFLGYFAVINIFLGVLNLTPVPPLDGGRIV
ncbi:MAG: site-2 protease family protein, partial [Deltaproteobacteria bacterium]|nr:site-2 protease family protein [Deltaproteobacteria bacterium]